MTIHPHNAERRSGKQLADAKAVNQRNKVAINHEETFDSNVLFKGITDNTPREAGLEIVNKTFFSPTESDVINQWQHHLTVIKILTGCLAHKGVKAEDLDYWKTYKSFLDSSGIGEKLVSVAGSPTNYIPTGWSNELLQYFYQELEVAALFNMFPMPQNPYDWKL